MYERLFAKRGLSLDRMRVLLEVREAGSIAKAAGSDPVRQSQYSRQLKELDEFFGVELTRRRGRTMALTPAGEELAALIKEHFIALGQFSRRLADDPIPVFIAAGESLVHWVLVPMVPKLQQTVRGIALRLQNCSSSDINAKLLARDADLGLLRKDAVAPNLRIQSLGRVSYALYVPKALAKTVAGSRSARLLAELSMATIPPDYSVGRDLHQLGEKAGIRINVRLECDSFAGLARAVDTEGYAAVLPTYAEPHLRGDTERVALPLLKPMIREIALAWQDRKVGLRPEIEKVQRWMAEELTLETRVTHTPPIAKHD